MVVVGLSATSTSKVEKGKGWASCIRRSQLLISVVSAGLYLSSSATVEAVEFVRVTAHSIGCVAVEACASDVIVVAGPITYLPESLLKDAFRHELRLELRLELNSI
jgi:hypothetical protein